MHLTLDPQQSGRGYLHVSPKGLQFGPAVDAAVDTAVAAVDAAVDAAVAAAAAA
eukprot:CAMPEP_0197744280 /NCGR_PEP_ID=MMETSP1435-20131217/38130_1 /TAXON_ID=426625 /ORGANISM="Chaetoceros brevis, Strain CCMP164" /LENGTH=53 /DNA_ID=CAMNT_0043335587 /DNA_START=57 /DNA_END=215 /DNA_ORIENTATION=+